MSLSDKPNPNNPIVFFDISVGGTVNICLNLKIKIHTFPIKRNIYRKLESVAIICPRSEIAYIIAQLYGTCIVICRAYY